MSTKTEENNLKQEFTLGCEPTAVAVTGLAEKVKRTTTRKSERAVRKGTSGIQSKVRVASRTNSPKRASKAISRTAPAESAVRASRIIGGEESSVQEQKSLQSLTASLGSETHAASKSTIVVRASGVEENDLVAAQQEIEAATDRELSQTTGTGPKTLLHWLTAAFKWAVKIGGHQAKKRLRVCESVSLGEKRFVAVIEVDGEQFLVGGASSSVATLARLESQQFSTVFKRRWAQEPVQA